MQKRKWDMMTQFVFPEQLGAVEEVVTCNITPRWQQVVTDDSIQLNGIYHITAVAKFNPYEMPTYGEGTLIEDLEFDGNNGYFEYALPLNVDLPRENVADQCTPEVIVEDVSYFVYDGSNCTFKWDVQCSYEEPVQQAVLDEELAAPIMDDQKTNLEPPQEEYTQELRFGYDGIFPDTPTLSEEPQYDSSQSPTTQHEAEAPPQNERVYEDYAIETEPKVSINSWDNSNSKDQSVHDSENLEFRDGEIIEDIDERPVKGTDEPTQSVEKEGNESATVEKRKEEKRHFFPTDTDDFYNELTESYTLLNVSNKIHSE